MLQRTIKIVSVIAIVALTLVIGESLGPKPVNAKVYQVIYHAAQSGADVLELGGRPGGQREFVVNGQRFLGEISQTRKTPKEIIQKLTDQSRNTGFDTEDQASLFEDLDLSGALKAILNMSRPFKLEGSNWGVFGQMYVSSSTGALKQDGYIVFAHGAQSDGKTDVWTMNFPAGFNPFKVLPDLKGDSPGAEVDGIERYPGSRRVYTLSERSAISNAHIVAYAGYGSVQQHTIHYRNTLLRAGLREKTQLSGRSGNTIMRFEGKNKELDISISQASGSSNIVLDVIQARFKGGRS